MGFEMLQHYPRNLESHRYAGEMLRAVDMLRKRSEKAINSYLQLTFPAVKAGSKDQDGDVRCLAECSRHTTAHTHRPAKTGRCTGSRH